MCLPIPLVLAIVCAVKATSRALFKLKYGTYHKSHDTEYDHFLTKIREHLLFQHKTSLHTYKFYISKDKPTGF